MKVNELFNLYQGNGFELMHIEQSDNSGVNFISRTAENNGVVARVCADKKVEPFPAGNISVALGGSVLSAFVQLKPFYTAFHIMVLTPKKEMTLQEKLYYCMCIKYNAYRYNYGRQANKTLKDIDLPDRLPDWVYSVPAKPIKTKIKSRNLPLDAKDWKEFKVGGLFDVIKGIHWDKDDMEYGGVNFIGAISGNNGVRQTIKTEKTFASNCITVNYNGSVGEAFYQSEPFWASGDINILYAKNWKLNKYIALFLVTLIKMERFKYNYGRKWTVDKLNSTTLKLPAKDGEPDWGYMENYIKSLPYSDKI